MPALRPVPRWMTPSSAGAIWRTFSDDIARVWVCACWYTTSPSGPVILVTSTGGTCTPSLANVA